MEEEAIFRSATMSLVQFYVTSELARDVVHILGQLGTVHFRDLNSRLTAFQRTFMNELRTVDEIESQLAYLETVMVKHETVKGELYRNLEADFKPLPTLADMEQLKQNIKQIFDRVKHLDDAYNKLNDQKVELIENRSVLAVVNEFQRPLGTNPRHSINEFEIDSEDEGLMNQGLLNGLEQGMELETADLDMFTAMAGAIDSLKIPLLRKILWRTLRGNLYFHDVSIEGTDKSVFLVYIHGDALKQRVRRIIQSLDGTIYSNVNGDTQARTATLTELNQKIGDLETVNESTHNLMVAELLMVQESYTDWVYIIKRERRIYDTMNKFDMDGTRRCLVGEGWIPSAEIGHVRESLRRVVNESMDEVILEGGERSRSISPAINSSDHQVHSPTGEEELVAVVTELSTNRTPPTYHKTNKFTGAFQLIVDAYGIATYQEVNPGLATVITFPFMFAIMFGDIGHGIILSLIAGYLVRNERSIGAMRNRDEVFDMAYSGRYVLLLMGLFSVYTGALYNDVFSKSMTLFKSGWKFDTEGAEAGQTLVAHSTNSTYPFGLDWGWHGAENNLLFTNSYKMKLSVLMGFIHMTYSLCFSLVNYRHRRSRVDIMGNFIPGMLFMQSIFGYLSLSIVYKWCVDWNAIGKAPPGLLNMLINMFLSPGNIDVPLYPGQSIVQIVLLLIALVCVPWLLIYKPLTLRNQNKRAMADGYSDLHSQRRHSLQVEEELAALHEFTIELENEDEPQSFQFPNDLEPLHPNSTHDGDHFELGEVVIHQVIHTIEFCLNCVSHTASYLRLWALSLAHAQLSSVLWSMTIANAFHMTGTKGIIMTVLLFGFWFVLTVCILVLMEGTSAMLHSLRLHWVEAMSKFFEGEGYAYEPFTFDIDL